MAHRIFFCMNIQYIKIKNRPSSKKNICSFILASSILFYQHLSEGRFNKKKKKMLRKSNFYQILHPDPIQYEDHNILISRMEQCVGIKGTVLEWFRSYLSGRGFSVGLGDFMSSSVCFS